MIARTWRGWTATDDAEKVAADLRAGVMARYAAAPGNVSAYVLSRPIAGGVELTTMSLWESAAAVPDGVAEAHPLLVARQTEAVLWTVAGTSEAVARAA